MVSRTTRHPRVRPAFLLMAFAGAATGGPASGQVAPSRSLSPPDLVVLPIRLLDTSGEPGDQSAAHAARLAGMVGDLADRLGTEGSVRAAGISAEALAQACPDTDAGCILAQARRTGAPLAFVGVVHKSSTLIMQMFARVVDTASGATQVSRELNFRGDTDESWRRMTRFLARDVVTALRTKN